MDVVAVVCAALFTIRSVRKRLCLHWQQVYLLILVVGNGNVIFGLGGWDPQQYGALRRSAVGVSNTGIRIRVSLAGEMRKGHSLSWPLAQARQGRHIVAQGEVSEADEPWESGVLQVWGAPEARQMKCAGRFGVRHSLRGSL
jgi:hypothetical protein